MTEHSTPGTRPEQEKLAYARGVRLCGIPSEELRCSTIQGDTFQNT